MKDIFKSSRSWKRKHKDTTRQEHCAIQQDLYEQALEVNEKKAGIKYESNEWFTYDFKWKVLQAVAEAHGQKKMLLMHYKCSYTDHIISTPCKTEKIMRTNSINEALARAAEYLWWFNQSVLSCQAIAAGFETIGEYKVSIA